MKSLKTTRLIPIFCLLIMSFFLIDYFKQPSERVLYEQYINEHAYLHREPDSVSKINKPDRPDLAWELNFLLTMDPNSKKPERERLLTAYRDKKTKTLASRSTPGHTSTPWVERGPTNVGGRTRALVFDPEVTNKVWAGGVTGGLWYNDDITDENSVWTAVDDFWDNLAVTKIVFDPNNSSNIYVGTGEGWYTSSSVGAGVWKSTDGGSSWNQLTATADYHFVNDLAVRDESYGVSDGVVYVASSVSVYEGSNHGSNGIFRSGDGGNTFVQQASFTPTDLCIGADNRIWSGTGDGRIMYSDNGTTWTEVYDSNMGRVAIACAESNDDYIYALIEDADEVGEIVYTDDKGLSWNNATEPEDSDTDIPSTDFARGQAWYDLVIAVDPNDANTVVVGGIDLFRSTNHGTSWSQISRWYAFSGTNSALVHADQHAIEFKGAGSDEVIFGNDGGIYYSADLEDADQGPEIEARNNNYNVTQLYSCALHPDSDENFFLAGSQDNGTQRFQSAGLNETVDVYGGDGAFCFIDQTDPNYQIVSYVYNYYGLSTNGGSSFSDIQLDQTTGLFINPTDYDNNLDVLYSSRTNNTINRISGISSTPLIDKISVSLGTTASHLRVSEYTTTSTTLFVGTLGGRVFRIEDADGSSPSTTEITGGSFPVGSVSCIELGAHEDELLVTFSNYGIISVWYTNDGGATWSAKEGDLSDMPVRWALFNPNDRNEAIIATELGVWNTSDISSESPVWSSANDGLANVRVDMLQIRGSDYEVIAATYGRGLFSSTGFRTETEPIVSFEADITSGCGGELTVAFTDNSTANPDITSWEWSFPGGTPNTSTDQNPTVVYDVLGTYDVSLTVTNTVGSVSESKMNYITLGGASSLPFFESFEGDDFPPSCWRTYTGANGLGVTNEWERSTTASSDGVASAYVQFENTSGGENIEDWLVSPPISLVGSLSSILTFDAKQAYGNEFGAEYHIYVSTTSQTDIASFTNLMTYTEDDFLTNAFDSFTVDLSAYDGQTIYLAFVMEQLDGDDWYLDNISVQGIFISASHGLAVCNGETTTFSVPSVPSNTYQWKLNGVQLLGETNSSYIPVIEGAYSVAITSNGVTLETNAVDFMIDSMPTISSITNDFNICQNEATSISIDVLESSVGYQWFKDGDVLDDEAAISGATTDVLSFTNVSSTDTGVYTCVVTNGSCELESGSVTMTVEAIDVTTSSADISACGNEPLSLSIDASESEATYQWLKDGVVMVNDVHTNGVTTNTLTIDNFMDIYEGNYTCMTWFDGCQQESEIITVTLDTGIDIITQPEGTEVCAASDLNFFVEVTGNGLTYQWFFENEVLEDGMTISGSDSNTLFITSTSIENIGSYHCEISNKCGMVVASDVVTFTFSECLSSPAALLNSLNLFPSPTTGLVKMSLTAFETSRHMSYDIYRLDGKLMMHDQLSLEEQLQEYLSIDLRYYRNGVYIIMINIDDLVSKKQVIKR